MRSRCSAARLGLSLLLAVPLLMVVSERGAWPRADETAAEEDRERPLMERFLALLERSPRRGTALDRVHAYHLDRGMVDALIARFRDRTAKDQGDGAAWMILGLLEAKRGRDSEAAAALRQAETHRPDDPLVPYYLGQSLILSGQPEAAVDAFERALKREPGRADLLEIYQALGRVHQRAHRFDRAMEVWTRLEGRFPDDLRVREEIAAALAEEAQLEPALARYEALARKTSDSYKGVQYRIEAAGLETKLGRKDEALARYEAILGSLNPESWLYRDVRRRIEAVFLGGDDPAGLALYYERWLAKHPDDFEAMARLGTTLAAQGRQGEASDWLAKAVKLAPSRKAIRIALIELLVRDEKIAEAATHYEAMDRADPGNPDLIRDWGRLLLRDKARTPAERKASAAAIWRRLVAGKPDDAVAAVRLAELLRQAELTEEAIATYQKAIALAPGEPQYLEYLGEYYQSLKRTDEALATWRRIVVPDRNAKNLSRLAEVFAGFGYREEAIQAISDACKLDPQSFDLRFRRADLLHDARRFEDAAVELEAAAALADDDEQREATLDRQITNSQAAGTLVAQVKSLRDRLAGDRARDAETWRRLARYLEADQKWDEATSAIGQALAIDERSVPSWAVAARLFETSRNLEKSAEAYRKLAGLDRQGRAAHLANVARIEARLGRRGPALEAGRALLAAAPGNVENYQFFADLCFQLGETEQALETLRRATRTNAGDPKPLLSLAEALARETRTVEAIELFWRAFEKTSELEGKLDVVARLAERSTQAGGDSFDRLVSRFERLKSEEKSRREAIFCLARAYTVSGDHAAARKELELLLADNPRDLPLLEQLSVLAETEGELDDALSYQERIDEIAASTESATRLAQLYLQAGEDLKADAIWERLASEKQNAEQALRTADRLWTSGKHESALRITNRLLLRSPEDWEVLYREARILQILNRHSEAADRFTALLKIRRSDDDAATRTKPNSSRGTAANMTAAMLRATATMAPQTTMASQAQMAPQTLPNVTAWATTTRTAVASRSILASRSRLFLTPHTFPAGKRLNAVPRILVEFGFQPGWLDRWLPEDFGQARMAALAGLYTLGRRDGAEAEWLDRQRIARDRTPQDLRRLRDWYYLQLVLEDQAATSQAALALARVSGADPSAHWWLLASLPDGAEDAGAAGIRRLAAADDPPEALTADGLDQTVASHSLLIRLKPEWLWSSTRAHMTPRVIKALERAGQAEAIDALYREAVASATDLSSIAIAAELAADRGDVDALLKLFEVFHRIPGKRAGPNEYMTTPSGSVPSPVRSMARVLHQRADAMAHGDILRLLDHYFDKLQSPEQVAERAKAAYPPVTMSQQSVMSVWRNNTPRSARFTYPQPGRTLDYATILLLRNAFEVYQRDGLSEDLLAHFRRPIDGDESEARRIYAHLALSAFHWWSNQPHEAIEAIERAASLPSADPELRLMLAELVASRREPKNALELAQSIDSTDQALLQRREILVLRIALQTGDGVLARLAAEKLAGFRLPQVVRMQLATQMSQSGLSEIAARLYRRPRQGTNNNRTSSQLNLLRKYQADGKTEAAVQVATRMLHQASRKNLPEKAEAIKFLEKTGKLAEFLERARAQIKREPHSLSNYLVLADYYLARRQGGEVEKLFDQAAQARPHDARFQVQIATALIQSGNLTGGIDRYDLAIKQDPSLLGERYSEIVTLYSRANRLDGLVELLGDADLARLRSSPAAASIVAIITSTRSTRADTRKLFRKAWEAFPEQRPLLMSSANDDHKRLPEIYKYACEAVIPGQGSTRIARWHGFDKEISRPGDAAISTAATRLLDVATTQKELGDLVRQVERALAQFPTWSGGKALLALIQLREGRTGETRRLLDELLADKAGSIPMAASMILGQEMQRTETLIPQVISLYEGAIGADPSDSRNGSISIAEFPIPQLVSLYLEAGQVAKSRELLLAAIRNCPKPDADPASRLALLQHINSLHVAAEPFLTRGLLLDSIRISSAIAEHSEPLMQSQLILPENPDLINQYRYRYQTILKHLGVDSLAPTVREFLKPEPERWGEALDLILMFDPLEPGKAPIVSLPAEALRKAAKDPKLRTEIKSSLDDLVRRYPEDFSVSTAAALAACAEKDRGAILEAGRRLERLAAARPLDTLPDGTQANALQRSEAAKRLGLWLVSRECRQFEETRELARGLAQVAIEAARRQPDPRWLRGMLLSGGHAALGHGSRDEAEAYWTEWLEIALAPDPAPPKVRPEASPVLARTPGPGPSTPAAATRAIGGGRPRPIPTKRFAMAMQMARLATEHGFHALAARAVQESLKGGPPIPDSNDRLFISSRVTPTPSYGSVNNAQVMFTTTQEVAPSSMNESVTQVSRTIQQLDQLWEKHDAPAESVYQALCEVVLPSALPDRIFPYEPEFPPTQVVGGVPRPRTSPSMKRVETTLIRWAVRAGKVDDLRRRLEQRKLGSTDRASAQSILASLEAAKGNESPR